VIYLIHANKRVLVWNRDNVTQTTNNGNKLTAFSQNNNMIESTKSNQDSVGANDDCIDQTKPVTVDQMYSGNEILRLVLLQDHNSIIIYQVTISELKSDIIIICDK